MWNSRDLVMVALASGLVAAWAWSGCADDEEPGTGGAGGASTSSTTSSTTSTSTTTTAEGGGGAGGSGGSCNLGGGGCEELVADGSFEEGSPSDHWDEASTNFGTPLCTAALCGGPGTGSGPWDCQWWAWFGGISAAYEEASLAQQVALSDGAAFLRFRLEMSACDSPQDYLEVRLDEERVFLKDGSDPLCGQVGYEEQTVDLSDYADGDTHQLVFHSETFGLNAGASNFFVDHVSVSECGAGGGGGTGGAGGSGGTGGAGGAGGTGGS